MALPLSSEQWLAFTLSITFVLIAVVIGFIVGLKGLKSYRQTKGIATFFFALSVLGAALALLFVVLEKFCIIVFQTWPPPPMPDPTYAVIFGYVAQAFSILAIISICTFAFNMAAPKLWKIFAVIVVVFMAIFGYFWFLGPVTVDWAATELAISEISQILVYAIDTPLLIIPMLVFFYYAVKVRAESPKKSHMSLFMGLGLICFNIGSIVEIVGFDIWIATIGRFLFIPAMLFYYWGLFRVKGEK